MTLDRSPGKMRSAGEVKREIMRIFDAIAEEFDRSRSRIWIEEVSLLLGRKRVLDLGCGNGRNGIYLLDKGSYVVFADISFNMLRIVGMKRPGSQRVQCDASALPFRDQCFDGLLFIATLHHLPKEERLASLKEIRRILRPRGFAVISAWALFQPRFLRKIPEMIVGVLKGGEFGDLYVPWGSKRRLLRYYHLMTRRELTDLVRRSGLRVLSSYGKRFKTKFFSENHVVLASREE